MSPTPSVIEAINKAKSILIHFHLSPDPDSVGSALATAALLESIGKKVTVYSEDRLPPYVAKLPLGERVSVEPLDLAIRSDHDLYLALDTAVWKLGTRSASRPTKPVANIDHHPDNTLYADYEWIEPAANSTAQLVLILAKTLKAEVTPDIATLLLFGILGDTSCLQNGNTSYEAIQSISELIKLGGRYHECIDLLLRSYTPADLKAWSEILNTIALGPDNWYAYLAVDYEHWAIHGSKLPTGELANMFTTRIDGTKFGALFIEKSPGFTNCSLRSRDRSFDVSAVAHHFGGGGHQATSSIRFELPLKEALNKFITEIAQIYDHEGIIKPK